MIVQIRACVSTVAERLADSPCVMSGTTPASSRISIVASRFRWQSGVIALATITLAFLVPGIALCKVVPLTGIAWGITIATLLAGFGLFLASCVLETRTPQYERVDHFLQASILVVAAGFLWLHMSLQTAPWRERTIGPGSAFAIVMICAVIGAGLMFRRGRRRAMLATTAAEYPRS